MSSVTRELNNTNSPLYRWLMEKMSKGGYKIINHHNAIMAKQWSSIIAPTSYHIDFPLVGMAITYGMRYYFGNLDSQIHLTAAGVGAAKLSMLEMVRELLRQSLVTREICVVFLLLAALDSYGRGGNHDILVFLNPNGAYLPLDDKFFERYHQTIEDVENLAIAIPRLLSNIEYKALVLHPNPTFSGSSYIHADAQLIVDGILLDVRTTTKKRPFSIANLFQQICYVLMDWDNEYNLRALAWVYSRQQNIFHYPTEKLFKDLPSLRQEFKEFVMQQYPINYNLIDYEQSYLFGKDDNFALPD